MISATFNLLNNLNKSDKFTYFIILVMSFIATLLELIGLGLVIPFMGIILNSESFKDIIILSNLIKYFNLSETDIFLYALLVLVLVFLIKNIYLGFLTYIRNTFIMNINKKLTKKLSKFYFHTDYKFHLNSNSSLLIRNLQSEIPRTTTFMQYTLILLNEIILIIGILFFIFLYNPYVFFIVIPVLFFFGVTFVYFTKSYSTEWGRKQSLYDGKSFKIIMEGLSNIKLAKSFNKINYFYSNFINFKSHKLKTDRNITTLNDMPRLFLEVIAILTFSITFYLLFLNDYSKEYILSTLALFAVAAFKVLPSIGRIITSISSLKFHLESTNIVCDLLFKNNIIINERFFNEKINNLKNNSKKIISIENVSFHYDKSINKILKNISLDIYEGDYVGIIGKSGAGKTTLIDLMLGLLKPTSGIIRLLGEEVFNNHKQISKFIGYVPQSNVLSDLSIRQNIAFGIPEENIDNALISKVIELANLKELIGSLEKKEFTLVGERGVRLSGGQVQRISIARALYNQPKILFFDEATSSLDKKTEDIILEDINSLKRNHTLIMITHNPETLKYCNRLYEIKNNKINKIR